MSPSPRFLWVAALALPIAALPLVVPGAWVAVVLLWGAMALAAGADVAVLRLAAPRVQTLLPHAVGVGSSLEVECHVERGGRWPLRAVFRPQVGELLVARDVETKLPAGATQTTIAIDAMRRGRTAVESIWLRLEGPLGFVRRVDEVPITSGEVHVIPNARRVREMTLEYFGSQPLGGGLKMPRRAEEGRELDALATYEPGMDMRQVDWKTSARHQELRVRRYRLERHQRVFLCVDTGRLMRDPIDGLDRLDHAIHAALVVGEAALRAGDLVGLYAYGAAPRGWVAPGAGLKQVARLRRACSELDAAPEETNHVLGIHTLLGKLRRRSLIVLFTELVDSTTAELMVEHLGHLARRHLLVFVALDDPIVEEPLRRAPETAHDLGAAIAAGRLRAERHGVLRRLERMRVNVVSGAPRPATLALLKRYVDVKRRGLIG